MSREPNRSFAGLPHNISSNITIGIVKDNSDPAEHGRLKVYIPSLDDEDFDIEDLPWCMYASPFGGVNANNKVGRDEDQIDGITAYGFWAVPKNGAQVLVACIDGNPNMRVWFGCVYMPEHNRTLPAGIDGIKTEIDESGAYPQSEISTYRKVAKDAGHWEDSKNFKTIGAYERSVSHPTNKDQVKDKTKIDNGYAPKLHEKEKSDSQIICLTSPGKHHFTMSDIPSYCRMRFRTTAGHQIILDDTNERIYVSTAKGKSWIELDENGTINVYSDSKLNITGNNDVNIHSNENLNLSAAKRVNIVSEQGSIQLSAKTQIKCVSTHGNINLLASRDLSFKTTNGPRAEATPEVSKADDVKGAVYNWPEEEGSSSSKMRVESVNACEIRSINDSVVINGKDNVHVRSISGSTYIHSDANVYIKAEDIIGQANTANFNATVKGNSFIQPAPMNAEPAKVLSNMENSGSSGASLQAKMNRTAKEPWGDRTKDETIAPTKRNSNYQG